MRQRSSCRASTFMMYSSSSLSIESRIGQVRRLPATALNAGEPHDQIGALRGATGCDRDIPAGRKEQSYPRTSRRKIAITF
jgi:hypothetical protein